MATVLWGWHTNGSFAVVTAAASAYCHLAQSLDSTLRKASDIIKQSSIFNRWPRACLSSIFQLFETYHKPSKVQLDLEYWNF